MNEYNPLSKIDTAKKTQSDNLAREIKKLIIDGELKTNVTFKNENEMCKLLNVSRSTLREAYKILEIEGYISRTKHGTYVNGRNYVAINGNFNASLELAQYNDLIEFLCILETEAVSLAASRVQKDQLAEIEKYKNLCDQYRYNQGAIQEYNDQFHLQIRMASNNKLIVSALSASYEQFNRNIIRTLIKSLWISVLKNIVNYLKQSKTVIPEEQKGSHMITCNMMYGG